MHNPLPTVLGSQIAKEKEKMVAELREALGLPEGRDWAACLDVVRQLQKEASQD